MSRWRGTGRGRERLARGLKRRRPGKAQPTAEDDHEGAAPPCPPRETAASSVLSDHRTPPRREAKLALLVAPTLEVPLELAGDGLAGGLGELGGVAGLLERPDVLGDVLVLLGELVDAALGLALP